MRVVTGLIGAALVLGACGDGDTPEIEPRRGEPIAVTSDAFADGETIPDRYSCDGDDVSPPLAWEPVDGARSYVVRSLDVDAGGFVHWFVVGIPPDVTEVAEGEVPAGAIEGGNDFGEVGYGGPCPPEGDEPHRYDFTVVALDEELAGVERGADLGPVLAEMEGSVLMQGELTGTYGR